MPTVISLTLSSDRLQAGALKIDNQKTRVLVARAALDLIVTAHISSVNESVKQIDSAESNAEAPIGKNGSNDSGNQSAALLLVAGVAARNDIVAAGIGGFLDGLAAGAGDQGRGGGQDGKGEDGGEALHFGLLGLCLLKKLGSCCIVVLEAGVLLWMLCVGC